MPTISGRDWRKIIVAGEGIPYFDDIAKGLRGISYSIKQEKEPVHGKGEKPVSIGRAKKRYEGSFKLLPDAAQYLMLAAKALSGDAKANIIDLPGVPFALFGTNNADDLPFGMVIEGLEFTEQSEDLTNETQGGEVNLPWIALDVTME